MAVAIRNARRLPRHARTAPTPVTVRDPPDTTIVTGATGWFGRALLAALTDPARVAPPPIDPCARHDDPCRGRDAALPGVEAVVGDVRTSPGSTTCSRPSPSGRTVDVIHAAGVIHPRTPSDWVEVNARGTANVAARPRAAGVRRFVHVSSNSPFGTNPHPRDVFRNDEPYDPYLGYGRSKMLAELRLLDEVVAAASTR